MLVGHFAAFQSLSSPNRRDSPNRRSSLERVEENQILDTPLTPPLNSGDDGTHDTPLASGDDAELEVYFICDYGCGFSAPFEVVATHEEICTWRHQKSLKEGSQPCHFNNLNHTIAASADPLQVPTFGLLVDASGEDRKAAQNEVFRLAGRNRFEIDIHMVASPQPAKNGLAIVPGPPPSSHENFRADPNNGGAELSQEIRLDAMTMRDSEPSSSEKAELRLQLLQTVETLELERQALVWMTERVRRREEEEEKLRRELDESRTMQGELKKEVGKLTEELVRRDSGDARAQKTQTDASTSKKAMLAKLQMAEAREKELSEETTRLKMELEARGTESERADVMEREWSAARGHAEAERKAREGAEADAEREREQRRGLEQRLKRVQGDLEAARDATNESEGRMEEVGARMTGGERGGNGRGGRELRKLDEEQEQARADARGREEEMEALKTPKQPQTLSQWIMQGSVGPRFDDEAQRSQDGAETVGPGEAGAAGVKGVEGLNLEKEHRELVEGGADHNEEVRMQLDECERTVAGLERFVRMSTEDVARQWQRVADLEETVRMGQKEREEQMKQLEAARKSVLEQKEEAGVLAEEGERMREERGVLERALADALTQATTTTLAQKMRSDEELEAGKREGRSLREAARDSEQRLAESKQLAQALLLAVEGVCRELALAADSDCDWERPGQHALAVARVGLGEPPAERGSEPSGSESKAARLPEAMGMQTAEASQARCEEGATRRVCSGRSDSGARDQGADSKPGVGTAVGCESPLWDRLGRRRDSLAKVTLGLGLAQAVLLAEGSEDATGGDAEEEEEGCALAAAALCPQAPSQAEMALCAASTGMTAQDSSPGSSARASSRGDSDAAQGPGTSSSAPQGGTSTASLTGSGFGPPGGSGCEVRVGSPAVSSGCHSARSESGDATRRWPRALVTVHASPGQAETPQCALESSTDM